MIIFIQARINSKRLPGKVLMEIEGKSILGWIIERIKKSDINIPVVVLTSDKKSDDRIEEFCIKNDINVFRGELDNVIQRFIDAAAFYKQDEFFRICADSPCFDPILLKSALYLAEKNPEYDLITNVHPRSFPKGQSVELIKLDPLQRLISFGLSSLEKEHITSGFYSREKEFKIYNFYNKIEKYKNIQLSVDTPNDLKKIKLIFQKALNRNKNFVISWEEIVSIYNSIEKKN